MEVVNIFPSQNGRNPVSPEIGAEILTFWQRGLAEVRSWEAFVTKSWVAVHPWEAFMLTLTLQRQGETSGEWRFGTFDCGWSWLEDSKSSIYSVKWITISISAQSLYQSAMPKNYSHFHSFLKNNPRPKSWWQYKKIENGSKNAVFFFFVFFVLILPSWRSVGCCFAIPGTAHASARLPSDGRCCEGEWFWSLDRQIHSGFIWY